VDISVEELSPVDKKLTISAKDEDIRPKVEAALKKYKSQINMPGFRPGKTPISIIRKRFGKAIEEEEVNKYIQDVFEKEVVPEYNPIGETEMLDLIWEEGDLEATFKIGTKPEFELTDLSVVEVDKLVHDVTDEEAGKEVERILKEAGNWEEVEEEITAEHRITVDAQALDENKEPIEGDVEKDQVLDLEDERNEDFLEQLKGNKTGDTVQINMGSDDEPLWFELTVKTVEKSQPRELTEEFVKQQTNGEIEDPDKFQSFVKSKMQDQYDQSAKEMTRREVVEKLVEAHDFKIPEVFVTQIQNMYLNQVKQQNDGELPDDFDEESFKQSKTEQAVRDGKWQFINEKLQSDFDDIEITPEDVDAYLEAEGARYGISVDQMKQIYAKNADQLERLRSNIREDKVFDKLLEEVSINELSKEQYQQKHENKAK